MGEDQDNKKELDPWMAEAAEDADQIVRASRGVYPPSAENLKEQKTLREEFLNWIEKQGLDQNEIGANTYKGQYKLKDGEILNIAWMSGQNVLRVESKREEWNLGLDRESEIRQYMFYIDKGTGLPDDNTDIKYGYSGSAKGSYNFVPGSRSKTKISATKIDVFPKMRELKRLLQDAKGELKPIHYR